MPPMREGRVLIATVASWALAGVIGVAMTTALILRSVGWISAGEEEERIVDGMACGRRSVLPSVSPVCSGSVRPYAVGEAFIAAGLVMLALTMEPHRLGWQSSRRRLDVWRGRPSGGQRCDVAGSCVARPLRNRALPDCGMAGDPGA